VLGLSVTGYGYEEVCSDRWVVGCIQTVKPVASAVASWIAGAVVLIRSVPDMLSRI
jgi:hypothetical protein